MNSTTGQADGFKPAMPLVSLELVVLTVQRGDLQVLLGKSDVDPRNNVWQLPRGVLKPDVDPSLDEAAQRVARELFGQVLPNLEQFAAVGHRSPEPDSSWVISVLYRSLVPSSWCNSISSATQSLALQSVKAAAKFEHFDRTALIAKAVAATRREIQELRFPKGWVPDVFALAELQALNEAVLGQSLDKVTFRRRMAAAGIATPVIGKMLGGQAHRPSQLYCMVELH